MKYLIPFVLCFLAAASQGAEVTTLAGKKYSGSLIGIAEGNVTIKTESGPIIISAKEMASIDFAAKFNLADYPTYDEVELSDSSRLRIAKLSIAGKTVRPAPLAVSNGPAAPVFEVPMNCMSYWLRGAQDAKHRLDWQKLLAGRGSRDLYVVREPERLSPIPGTILQGNDAGTEIEFERESDNTRSSLRLARATGGLIFSLPPRGIIPTTLCKLTDSFGNYLVVAEINFAGDAITVKTVSGASVVYTGTASFAKLDFSSGNIIYLSDSTPTVTAPPDPYKDRTWTLVNDLNLDNRPGFKFQDAFYPKGIRIQRDVTAEYKLNGDYREFKAIVGVDDSFQHPTAPSRLTIEADGKPVFSEVIKHGEKPRELTLDVKNVKLLKLRVDGEGAAAAHGITLADAKLQK